MDRETGTGKNAIWSLWAGSNGNRLIHTSSVAIPRANILGVKVSAIDLETALRVIHDWISRREPHYVCVTGVHGVMESQRDEELRRIHNAAGLVTPDGMPLVWLSRLMGFPHVRRVYGPDLMLALCARSENGGYRHFFYGGAAGVPEKLVARLQSRFPGLKAVGTYSPPFRALTPDEDRAIVRAISATQPDIVWVGISTPKQERWMAEHLARLNAPVVVGVGAAFDVHAGLKKQAPPWMQKSALEWSFRLLTEPRRLWRRYLINNPFFLWLIFLQVLGRKAAEDPDDITSTHRMSGGRSGKIVLMKRNMTTADRRADARLHSIGRNRGGQRGDI